MTRRYSKSDLRLLASDLGAELPPPKKSRRAEESAMQRAIVRWFDLNARTLFNLSPIVLLSIPNGSNGDAKRGSIMKAEGQRKGAPDLLLAVPRVFKLRSPHDPRPWDEHAHGCFLELKTPTGRLMPEQEAFHEILRGQGYRVEVVRSYEQGVQTITDYLK